MNTDAERLSRHHTLTELIASETARERGIDNRPGLRELDNLRRLAAGLDAVRDLLGHPLDISSGYRSPALNAAVGGVAGSQHTQGLAADFTCASFGSPLAVAQAIAASDIAFDQCILEFGRWVHLSFAADPRGRVLTIASTREGYREGLWDSDGRRVA
jgi:zinc D-Ala-D-Ala carboxypeptidase